MKRQHEIVVIDDETYVLRFVAQILAREGHNVRTATSGSEVSALARDPATDPVVLDLNLPDADGLNVHITHPRRKIGNVSGGANPIKTIRARGYLIESGTGTANRTNRPELVNREWRETGTLEML